MVSGCSPAARHPWRGFHAYGVHRNMGGWRNWSQNLLNGPPLPAPPTFTGWLSPGLRRCDLLEGGTMTERFPSYDVLAKRITPSWNEMTRHVIDERLALPREPRFFTPDEWQTLEVICGRIVPQPADGRRFRSPRWSTRSSTKTAATAIATTACRRCARLGRGVSQASTPRRGAGTMSASRGSTAPSKTRCCTRVQEGKIPGDWGGMPPTVFLPSDCCSTSSPSITPSDRLERNRLWRTGEPARLCPHGSRPTRSVGGDRSQARRRGGSSQAKCQHR